MSDVVDLAGSLKGLMEQAHSPGFAGLIQAVLHFGASLSVKLAILSASVSVLRTMAFSAR